MIAAFWLIVAIPSIAGLQSSGRRCTGSCVALAVIGWRGGGIAWRGVVYPRRILAGRQRVEV